MPGLGCGMWDIVPWPGIEPWPPALRAWSLSHQATREAPSYAPAQNYPHQVHEMPNHSVRCWSVLGVVQLHRTSQFIEHFLPFFDHSAELGGCGDLQSRDGSVSRCPWPTANAQRISGPGPSISASMMDFKIPNAFLTRLPSFEERIGSFSGGPLTETLCSQCREPGFDPWLANNMPQQRPSAGKYIN